MLIESNICIINKIENCVINIEQKQCHNENKDENKNEYLMISNK